MVIFDYEGRTSLITEDYFSVVLFIVTHEAILRFESVDEISPEV